PGRAALGRPGGRARPLLAGAAASPPRLEEESYFFCEDMSFPYGIHVAAVEVDVETGEVRIVRYGIGYDIGRAINPLLVDGQIVGGAAQGIGGPPLEEVAYDHDGTLAAPPFMDYPNPARREAAACRGPVHRV